jgi:hypothetical protein
VIAGSNTLSFVGVRVLLDEHVNGLGVRVLPGNCGLLRFSCGSPNLSRRIPDAPLEARGKMALIPKAGAERDLRQAELHHHSAGCGHWTQKSAAATINWAFSTLWLKTRTSQSRVRISFFRDLSSCYSSFELTRSDRFSHQRTEQTLITALWVDERIGRPD